MSFEEFVSSSEFKFELLELFTQFNSVCNSQSNSNVIKIIELSWTNVYKFNNKQYTLNFEKIGIDHIAGLNASGKSSVIYILAYALFGGKYSSLPMTKDLVLHNENTDHGNITCEFIINEDKYIISRTIMRKSTDKISLTCNNQKVECDQNILIQMFGDRDLFLSIFCATQNHEYFVDKTVKAKYSLIETLFGFESILENIKKFKSNYIYIKQLEKSLIFVEPEFYETKLSQLEIEIDSINSRIDMLKSNEYNSSYKKIKTYLSMFNNNTTISDIKSYNRVINIDTDIQKLKNFIPNISEDISSEYRFENIQHLFESFDNLYTEASRYINEHRHILLHTGFEDKDIKTELFVISNRINNLSINLFGESIQLTSDNIAKLNKKIYIELEKVNNTDIGNDSVIKSELYNLQSSITEYVNYCIEFVCSSTIRDNINLIRNDTSEYYNDLAVYYCIFKNLKSITNLAITDDQINSKITEHDELLVLIKNMTNLMCEKAALEEKISTNNKTIIKARTNKKELAIYEEYNNVITKYKDSLISESYKSLQDNWNKELACFFNSPKIKVSVEQSGEILITDFNNGRFISADVASGFQKFILDVTFRITMRELITNTPYYNILIIDEGFGVADDVNSKLIIPYLQSKSDKFKILVISHSTEFVNDKINQIEISKCEIISVSINKNMDKKNNSIGDDNCIISQNERLTFTCKCCNIVLSNKSTALKHIATKKHDLNYTIFVN